MTNIESRKFGRLAMRHEGNLWVAYYAAADTMDGAIFLGSIRIQFVQDQDRKARFLALMKEALADLIEEWTGTQPIWPWGEEPAPEHERGGHA